MESITREELTDVLKRLKLWVRQDPDNAVRGKVLHPEDAVNDIFIARDHAHIR